MEQLPRVLDEDEAWDKGLTQEALSLCGDGDILVGVILNGEGKPFAVIYSEREGIEPHVWLPPLEGKKWKEGGR
jgi:hypothetical protein